MSERKIRVGELIKRELSMALHSRWRSESVAITLTEVDISPDLKKANVYYSVLGGRENASKAGKFLLSHRNELRKIVGKNVIIKYTPELNFIFDPSVERGMRILEVLDELDQASPLDADDYPQDCDGSQHAEYEGDEP